MTTQTRKPRSDKGTTRAAKAPAEVEPTVALAPLVEPLEAVPERNRMRRRFREMRERQAKDRRATAERLAAQE